MSGVFAVDATGNMYVTGATGAQKGMFVSKYDSTGNEVWTHESEARFEPQTAIGQFTGSIKITVDSLGNAYVVSTAYKDIYTNDQSVVFLMKVDREGKEQWIRWIGPLEDRVKSFVVAVDGIGNVYVTFYSLASYNTFVRKFDSSGEGLWTQQVSPDRGAPSGYFHGASVAVDSVGNFYVAHYDSSVLSKYDSNGAYLETVDLPGHSRGLKIHPTSVALDGMGNIFIAGTYLGLPFVMKISPALGDMEES